MLYLSMQMEFRANLLKIEHRAHQNGRRLLGGVVKNAVQMGLRLVMSGCTPGRWAVGVFLGTDGHSRAGLEVSAVCWQCT